MTVDVRFRGAELSDAYGICCVIREAFLTDVAPHNSAQGIAFFLTAQSVDYYTRKIAQWGSVFVAEHGGVLVGVIALHDENRISPFFVLPAYQRRGVGRELLAMVWAECRERGVASVVLNSSPNAVGAYERFGFRRTGEEFLSNDVRCIPMEAEVPADGAPWGLAEQ
jgi:ribosomal protein S18 acetylase RimI-like enzyme